jgi:GMP synthase-like glutamine amidotransferase
LKGGYEEPVFDTLPEPFYIADFRLYQVIRPDLNLVNSRGYSILSQEFEPAQDTQDRAITAVRFSEYFIGTQFHPEADPEGMLVHFKGAKKQPIIDNVGEKAYIDMLVHLEDPDKIARTRNAVLPNFLRMAASQLALT